jgi:hypothetical protein
MQDISAVKQPTGQGNARLDPMQGIGEYLASLS